MCAEWILKCSGRFRWVGSEHWLTDYNSLPGEETTKHLKVQDVDLSESVAMAEGMKHFCKYFDVNYDVLSVYSVSVTFGLSLTPNAFNERKLFSIISSIHPQN